MTTSFKQRNLTDRGARATMVCLLALAAVLLQGSEARAQWTQPDSAGNTSTTGTGNVGIGTTTPTYPITIVKDQPSSTAVAVFNRTDAPNAQASVGVSRTLDWSNNYLSFGVTAPSYGVAGISNTAYIHSKGLSLKFGSETANEINFFTNGISNTRMTIAGGGNVGIGTAAPISQLQVRRDNASSSFQNGPDFQLFVQNLNTTANNTVGLAFGGQRADGTSRLAGSVFSQMTSHADGSFASDLVFNVTGSGEAPLEGLRIKSSGYVGIGTTTPTAKLDVAGDIRVSGNINAKYQDVAEWVPSTQKLQAGTVVVLDTAELNHVQASAKSYDTGVAGVVSAQPGITLGEAGDGKLLVATTGRVKVRVDATRGAIKVGDLLVTSDVAGVAMRSQPLELGGVPIHRPGTIIGKALEPLDKGTGEILVLLSLQ